MYSSSKSNDTASEQKEQETPNENTSEPTNDEEKRDEL